MALPPTTAVPFHHVAIFLLGLLLLCCGTRAADQTAADYFIHSLPGAPEPLLKMHAGHIMVNEASNANLFFWLFHNRHIGEKQRTVIWLNGGPGCSSEDGALMEVGPYRVKEDGTLRLNDGSWDEFANVVFVDQPAGTGFSYVNTDSYLHELDEMAAQFLVFMEKFFATFPEFEHDDIYFAGESYAGQHIPFIADAILKRNKGDVKHVWRLTGLLIGNGWISPTDHYMSYLPFAYKEKLVTEGSEVAKKLESAVALCTKTLEAGAKEHVDEPKCEAILSDILDLTKKPEGDRYSCYNMYDVRLTDTSPSCGMNWPPDLEWVKPYLRKPEVTKALHINPDKRTGWVECNGQVGSAFSAHKAKPSIQLLPSILQTVPIVLFSGAKDLICNYIGTENFIKKMQWNGGTGFEISPGVSAPRRDWTFEGESAGIYQEARNLTYVLFYNSSHMVPFDYSRRSRDMLDRFLGVDIASIGGVPADSRIDGEKGLETSVGGHPNSTAAQEEERHKLEAAKWEAYYKSGEVALVVVAIAAGLWGWFVWRDRRKRAGYTGVAGGEGMIGELGLANGRGLEGFRQKRGTRRDVEAADFDESELDDLAGESSTRMREKDKEMERDRYSVRGGSSEDEAESKRKARAK
ncbi:MAG: Cell death protease [Vezdaea aestivalis]|nr:MAG: Cell death protease [Vezdaea aestivalis]